MNDRRSGERTGRVALPVPGVSSAAFFPSILVRQMSESDPRYLVHSSWSVGSGVAARGSGGAWGVGAVVGREVGVVRAEGDALGADVAVGVAVEAAGLVPDGAPMSSRSRSRNCPTATTTAETVRAPTATRAGAYEDASAHDQELPRHASEQGRDSGCRRS